MIIGLVLVVGGSVWSLLPWVDTGLDVVAMIAAFNAYAALITIVLALTMIIIVLRGRLLVRHPRIVGAGLIMVVAVLVGLQAPHWIPSDRPAEGAAHFTLVSINAHLGRADAASITAATADADVVAFTEITAGTAMRLADTDFAVRFPYQLDADELPARGAEGTMIYSRWPLSTERPLAEGTVHQNWITSTDVPELGRVTLVAVHAQRPFLTGRGWSLDQRLIRTALPTDPLTVVAGDFNASPDQVRIDGLTSAVDQTGAGWIRTFPVDPRLPRLLRIDHVLLGSGLTAASTSTLSVQRTDHLALRTVIARR